MTPTREQVVSSIKAKFGESRLAEVLAALDQYGAESHEREVNRVKLAILELSEGKIEKLLHWIKTAKVDYRDTLAAQELGPLSPEEGARLRAWAKNLLNRWRRK